MKRNHWIPAMFMAGVLAFTACSKDDGDQETFSDLTTEEHKQELESEGVEFVQNMSAVADLSLYDVIDQFVSLNDQASTAQVNKVVALGLTQIEATKSTANMSVQLKALAADGDDSFSADWTEEAGIYEWDSSTSSWTYTEAADQITYKFDVDGSEAVISATNFTYKTAANQTAEGFVIELPQSLYINITLAGTELCYFDYAGEWYDNDTPKLLEEELYLEGFKLVRTLDLQDKSDLKTSTSFTYNDEVIIASGIEIKGDIDYDSIIDEIDAIEADGDITAQDIVNSANAYFQIGNVKVEGILNIEDLISALSSGTEGIETEEDYYQMMADAMNDNAKLYVRYADSDDIIAKGEVYVYEDTYSYYDYGTDQYVDESYYDIDMRMVFGDGSAMSGDFFDNGFGDIITEINTLINEININYNADIDPVE